MTILSLLLQSWDEILRFSHDLHNTGVSWGAVITAILLWKKINRNKRFHERDIRMEGKLDALLKKEGIEWKGQLYSQVDSSKTVGTRYIKNFYSYSRRGIQSANQLRRNSLMLSKTWLVGLIGYLAYFAKQVFGVEVTDDVIDKLADFVLLAVALIPMFMNMVKRRKGESPSEPTQYTNTFESNR